MTNILETNYEQFSYNKEFIPTHNIFNINTVQGNVGIGNFTPKSHLDISNSAQFNGNLIITGNLFYNKNYTYEPQFVYTLFHNSISNSIDIGKLNYSSSFKNITDTGWKSTTNGINLNTLNNKPNSIIQYKSNIYNYSNSIDLISFSKIFITYISIYNSNNTPISNQNTLQCNSINTTNNNNGIYTLNQPIILQPNIKHTFTFSNNTLNNTDNIQIFGTYDYEAGSFWFNNNISNNNKYIQRNVGVYNINPSTALHIEGNTFIKNDLTSYSINSNTTFIKSNLNINVFKVKNIKSNDKLFINTPHLNISKSSNTLCTIGNTNITSDGTFTFNNLFKTNYNINTLIHKNTKTFLDLNSNSINLGYYFFTPTQISSNNYSNSLDTQDKTNIINITDNNINFKSNTIISSYPTTINNLNNILYIDGNVNTTSITSNEIIYNSNNITYNFSNTITNLKSDHLFVNSLAHLGTHVYTNNINVNKLNSDTTSFKLLNTIPNYKSGLVFLNNSNIFCGYDNSKLIQLTNFEANTGYNVNKSHNSIHVHKINSNFLKITNFICSHLFTKKLTTNYIKLPLHNSFPNNFKVNNSLAQLYFNPTKNTFNINDGTQFSELAFDPFNDSTTFYQIEKIYNIIKSEEQFIPLIPSLQYYTIKFEYGNQYEATFEYTTNINNTNNTKVFFVKLNKLYTSSLYGNKPIYLTIINSTYISTNKYKCTIRFDKYLDNPNIIDIHITKVPAPTIPNENKFYCLERTNTPNLYKIIEATTQPYFEKFKIKNYILYTCTTNNQEGAATPLLVFNIYFNGVIDNVEQFEGNIIHKYTLPDLNLNTDFYDFFKVNNNKFTYFNIKGNKLFLENIDTYIRIKNKRLIDNNKYSAKLFVNNTNNHYT